MAYDVITVGGGLAGSALATALAQEGMKVLVLERTEVFQDRVRGEQVHPWGVAELKELGLYDVLLESCGHELPWLDMFLWPQQIAHRDLRVTTPQQATEFSFYHPAMQETLVQAAEEAGAEVRRGVRVSAVEPGTNPCVLLEANGSRSESIEARIVVGCDGRRSSVRKWAGFEVHQDPLTQYIAGLLFHGTGAPAEDTSHIVINSQLGRMTALFPQRNGQLRAYLIWQNAEEMRLQGEEDIPRFIEESVKTGAPAECYEGASPAGPLATFDAVDRWVPHPYRDGVALIGDAAAANDPSYGEGLSLTVRDVRVLRDSLLREKDWEKAGHDYASEHDRHYHVIHEVTQLLTKLFCSKVRQPTSDVPGLCPLSRKTRLAFPTTSSVGPTCPSIIPCEADSLAKTDDQN